MEKMKTKVPTGDADQNIMSTLFFCTFSPCWNGLHTITVVVRGGGGITTVTDTPASEGPSAAGDSEILNFWNSVDSSPKYFLIPDVMSFLSMIKKNFVPCTMYYTKSSRPLARPIWRWL